MFTYIRLKNFMSLKDVTFNLKNGSKGAKSFVAVYGENGSGKSNFVYSINLLRQSIDSFEMSADMEKMKELVREKELPKRLLDRIMGNADILNITGGCRMAECDEETSIEYGFQIGKHEGYYIMSFAERFVYEKLYYFIVKQSVTLFEIKLIDGKILPVFSNKLFADHKVEDEIRDEVDKYWGKHTFLSILNRERSEKNEQYIEAKYLSYAFDILNMLQETTVYCKKSSSFASWVQANEPDNILERLESGKVQIVNESVLYRSESILNDFITQA